LLESLLLLLLSTQTALLDSGTLQTMTLCYATKRNAVFNALVTLDAYKTACKHATLRTMLAVSSARLLLQDAVFRSASEHA
jgi:hypothetical protein